MDCFESDDVCSSSELEIQSIEDLYYFIYFQVAKMNLVPSLVKELV